MRVARWLSLWALCTLTQTGALGQAAELPQSPVLQKPVSLRLIMRPLREAIEQIASQTGGTLGVAKSIEQYKITLVVRERPAWQTLQLIAQVYGLEWRSDESEKYYLTEPTQTRAQRQRAQQAELQALQRALTERLQSYQRAAQTDFLTLRQRIESIDAERAQLEERQPPDWIDRASQLATERAQIGAAGESLLCYLLGVLSREWTRDQLRRLWNGQPLLASTTQLADAQPLPEATLRWLAAWSPAYAERPPQSAQMVIQWNPSKKVLSLAIVARSGEESLSFVETISLAPPDAPSAKPPKPLPESIAQTPLRRMPNEPPPNPPYWGKQFTLAEQLAWLADHTDLNIVADAFRLPASAPAPERTALTVGDWVQQALAAGGLEIESPQEGWLMARHHNQAELLASEIDEPTLERFESRAATGLTIDDYAELAYLLTPAQQLRMETPNGFALRFDPAPLQSSVPALRFWASLTSNQKQAAQERQPLQYLQLSTAQQRLFWEAIENALLNPTIPSGDLLLQLELLYDAQTHHDLAFFIDYWKNIAFEIQDGSATLTFEDVASYEQTLKEFQERGVSVETRQHSRLNYYLYFGYETRLAAQYTVSIDGTASPPASQEKR